MTYSFKLQQTEIEKIIQEKEAAKNYYSIVLSTPDGNKVSVPVPKSVFEEILTVAKPKPIYDNRI